MTMRHRIAVSFLLAGLAAMGVRSQDNADSRFGTVGQSGQGAASRWQWWRGYNQDYNVVTLPKDVKRLFTVGKLDDPDRNLGMDDWCQSGVPGLERVHPFNCGRSGEPIWAQEDRYRKILDWDKEGIRKVIRAFSVQYRQGLNSEFNYENAPEIHFTIGNEPNWFPYVSPVAYARVYKAYYDFIKAPTGLNCKACVIHNGGILLADWSADGVITDILQGTFTVAGELTGLPLVWRMFKGGGEKSDADLGYLEWTRRYLSELSHLGGRVDIFDAHAYDIDIGPGPGTFQIQENPTENLGKFLTLIKGGKVAQHNMLDVSLAAGQYTCREGCGPGGRYWGLASGALGNCAHYNDKPIIFPNENPCVMGSKVISVNGATPPTIVNMPYHYPNPVVWIDEFGLIKNGTTSGGTNASMNSMVAYFKSRPEVQKWFWYKNVGEDQFFGKLRGLTFGLVTSPSIALFTGNDLATFTSVGQNYHNLQQAFNGVPRTTATPLPAPYANLPRYVQSEDNITLNFEFGTTKTVPTQGWTFPSNHVLHPDGISWVAPCNTQIYRTFNQAERDAQAGARYFVMERGNFAYSDGDHFVFTVRSASGAESNRTVNPLFGGVVNPLANQGEAGVVDLSTFLQPGESISAVYAKFNTGLSCSGNPGITHGLRRAYFAKWDPVRADSWKVSSAAAACRFAGLTTIRPDLYHGQRISIPINIEKVSSGCALSLDGASASKGMAIVKQTVEWKPTRPMVGNHTGTLTLTCGSTTIHKPFGITIREGKVNPMTYLSNLLLQ